MTRLSDAQKEFAQHVAELIKFIDSRGYSVTLGDAYRDPRSHGEMGTRKAYGRAKSAHKQRLAIDLNLFDAEGNYLRDSRAHAPFGEFWKGLHPENRWGGDFKNPDGNHYSREHWGIA